MNLLPRFDTNYHEYTKNISVLLRALAVRASLALLFLTACQAQPAELALPPAAGEYPNGEILVDTGWLSDNIDHPGLRIIDMRSGEAYAQGHIPDAVNVPVGAIASTVLTLLVVPGIYYLVRRGQQTPSPSPTS